MFGDRVGSRESRAIVDCCVLLVNPDAAEATRLRGSMNSGRNGVGDPRRGVWLRLSVRCGVGVAALSRLVGRGSGSIIGGRVTLALHPRALSGLSSGRDVVLVSGTNGKTTTSHMLAAALGAEEPVAHNASGSNMADGAVAALAGNLGARLAVLEVDELHLASVAAQCAPKVVVLLNLSRDQLDRSSEVRRTATAIRAALAAAPGTTVFANADDPMTVFAVEGARRPVVWVAAGSNWREDSPSCPRCGGLLPRSRSGWDCACGFTRPEPVWWSQGGTAYGPGVEAVLRMRLPGRVNQHNALVALAVATTNGADLDRSAKAITGVDQVAGRYSIVRHDGRAARLLLAKNPAGWSAALDMIEQPRPVLIVINAREADGRDISWLWDVDFGCLAGRTVVVSGERAADLGVRLSYAGVPHRTEPDPLVGLGRLPVGEADVIANYSAFHALCRDLAGPGSPG